ncbi:transmembrane amino acid transporter protein-domain-containing protein [Mycena polygramma]|nr:transmembrane amino acid transporter protein-domain-containing protein [Mycena polygramma]KAJ7656473.1 transmembrane amino acid transporter protein-domain-containing protein [Mycena polygramma]
MAQKYGTAPVSALDEPTSLHNAGESSALLGGDAVNRIEKREGKASMVGSVSNLANTIIGSGMLTFPLAMASAGIIPGMITCVFSGSVAIFGLYLLSLCAARAPHRRSSFFAVSQMTFPKAAVFFDAAIAAKCFGVSISYLIIIKGLMPNVVAALYHDLSSSTPPAWALSGRNWITLFMLVLVPLTFLRHLNSLRHTSYVALFSVAYLVVIVITVYFHPLEGMPERGEVRLIRFTPGFVSTFPVQVFAFTCSQNLFPIFNELKDNTQARMNAVIGGAIGSATLTYEVIAIFGYLTFGSTVGANIIAMYPSTSLFVAVGQLAIVVLVRARGPEKSEHLRALFNPARNPMMRPRHRKLRVLTVKWAEILGLKTWNWCLNAPSMDMLGSTKRPAGGTEAAGRLEASATPLAGSSKQVSTSAPRSGASATS